MKKNATKSSITLPAHELKLVQALKKNLRLKSNVEVIRKSLSLLKESTEREMLRQLYQEASKKTRQSLKCELDELDLLVFEGL